MNGAGGVDLEKLESLISQQHEIASQLSALLARFEENKEAEGNNQETQPRAGGEEGKREETSKGPEKTTAAESETSTSAAPAVEEEETTAKAAESPPTPPKALEQVPKRAAEEGDSQVPKKKEDVNVGVTIRKRGKLQMMGGGLTFGSAKKKDPEDGKSDSVPSTAATTSVASPKAGAKADVKADVKAVAQASGKDEAPSPRPVQKAVNVVKDTSLPPKVRLKHAISEYVRFAPQLEAVVALSSGPPDRWVQYFSSWSVFSALIVLTRLLLSPLAVAFVDVGDNVAPLEVAFLFFLVVDIFWQAKVKRRVGCREEDHAAEGSDAGKHSHDGDGDETSHRHGVFHPGYRDSINFKFDCLSVATLVLSVVLPKPWDEIFLLISALTKLQRLLAMIDRLERVLNGHPSIIRLFGLVFLSFLAAHWVGCLWFGLGDVIGFGTDSWVPSSQLAQRPWWTKYIFALYWGFGNITTAVTPDPETPLEAAFQLVVLFTSVSMYATLLGNIGTLLANMDAAKIAWREKMDKVTTYMRFATPPFVASPRCSNSHSLVRLRGVPADIQQVSILSSLAALCSSLTPISPCLPRSEFTTTTTMSGNARMDWTRSRCWRTCQFPCGRTLLSICTENYSLASPFFPRPAQSSCQFSCDCCGQSCSHPTKSSSDTGTLGGRCTSWPPALHRSNLAMASGYSTF
jgi:Ion transport protein